MATNVASVSANYALPTKTKVLVVSAPDSIDRRLIRTHELLVEYKKWNLGGSGLKPKDDREIQERVLLESWIALSCTCEVLWIYAGAPKYTIRPGPLKRPGPLTH